MVKGLEVFREFFSGHKDNFLLIGGSACYLHMDRLGLDFRATKDLDILLIIEAYNAEFVSRFWEFIKTGDYQIQQSSSGKKRYYRFSHPQIKDFPTQLELFAKNPNLDIAPGLHLAPLPLSEDISSLSAILLDDDYYSFAIQNSIVVEDIRLATIPALICLKANAFINLKERKERGETLKNHDINKHKNDILSLASILAGEKATNIPKVIENTLYKMLSELKNDCLLINSPKIKNIEIADLINQIKITFGLQ